MIKYHIDCTVTSFKYITLHNNSSMKINTLKRVLKISRSLFLVCHSVTSHNAYSKGVAVGLVLFTRLQESYPGKWN